MIRKLLLPALLVGLLGGCVSYGYRDGYYYGQPGVEYRYHDYGYYPYGYGYYPYGEGYRYYNYYSPYYGYYPYYYNPYYYRHRRPPVTGTPQPNPPPGDQHDDDDTRLPPWRDLDRRRPVRDPRPLQADGTSEPPRREPREPQIIPREPSRRESRNEGPPIRQFMPRTQETRRRNSSGAREP